APSWPPELSLRRRSSAPARPGRLCLPPCGAARQGACATRLGARDLLADLVLGTGGDAGAGAGDERAVRSSRAGHLVDVADDSVDVLRRAGRELDERAVLTPDFG